MTIAIAVAFLVLIVIGIGMDVRIDRRMWREVARAKDAGRRVSVR